MRACNTEHQASCWTLGALRQTPRFSPVSQATWIGGLQGAVVSSFRVEAKEVGPLPRGDSSAEPREVALSADRVGTCATRRGQIVMHGGDAAWRVWLPCSSGSQREERKRKGCWDPERCGGAVGVAHRGLRSRANELHPGATLRSRQLFLKK